MTLDLGSRLGLLGATLALFSIAAFYMWPDKKWIGWVCLVFAGSLVLVWGVYEVREKIENSTASLVVSIFVGCLIGGLLAGLVWNSARDAKNTEIAPVQLSITCDTVSLPMPYRGDLWFLDTMMFTGIGKLSHPQEVLWPEPDVKGIGYKCTLKNHGPQTAFGVSLSFDVTVQDWVPGPHGEGSWQAGETKQTRAILASIPQPLGQLGTDQFSFYVCSYDPQSAYEVQVPSAGWINSDDPVNKRQVAIRVVSSFGNPLSVPAKMAKHPQKPKRR